MKKKRKKAKGKYIGQKKDAGSGRPGGLEADLVESNLQSPLALALRWSNIYYIFTTSYCGMKNNLHTTAWVPWSY